MKTFCVTVRQPKKTAGKYFTSRGVVAGVGTPEEACEVVRNHFPSTVRGWDAGTLFDAVEIPNNKFYSI